MCNRRLVSAALWLLLFACTHAQAFLREIAPGEAPRLAPDEGLLLVSVDTLSKLNYVRIQREGNFFASAKVSGLPSGVTVRLYAAPAGKYRWDKVEWVNNLYFELANDVEFKFELKAGVVNYPGDLLFRQASMREAELRATNRGLHAIDWLEVNHPAISRQLSFTYVGHYPDPFPDFYRKVRATNPDKQLAGLDDTTKLPASTALPLSTEELWQPGRIDSVALNPAGDLLAEAVFEKGKWGIDLIDLHSSEAIRLVNPAFAVQRMRWFGNRTLVTSLGAPGVANLIAIVQITEGGPKGRTFTNINLPYMGIVVGGVSSDPSQLLVASYSPFGQAMVHRVDISSQASVKASRHGFEIRLNKGLKDDFAWYADGSGAVRLALAHVDKQTVMLYGRDGEYRELMRFSAENVFVPYRLSPDGNLIYAITDQGRGQRDLVAFDPLTKAVVKTLFSRPGIDVAFPLFNSSGDPIGAAYYEAGHVVSDYFDDVDRHLYEQIEKAFPDRSVLTMARDDAGKQIILGVDGSDFPFAVYQLNTERHSASLVDQSHPALANRKLVPSQVIRTQGADGLPIEAYLTLPASLYTLPLIVLAHGGPIGIRDERHFDPEVQFFASLGYAVLQVNFRGSDGYGRAYREAGKGSYGTLIEDDIDSALQAALAKYPLDRSRMCAVGTSYGGYSALISAIRWPDRFRCVVSIAGVSDRLLFFTASDVAHSAAGRKGMEQDIGDPNTNPEGFYRMSPLYRYEELKAPVLLVHGSEDERVDYEHTRRLVRMLNLAGRPPSLIRLEGEGHGIRTAQNRAAAYPAIAAFLRQYLDVNSIATVAEIPAQAADAKSR